MNLLTDAERSSGWVVEFGVTMAKGVLKTTALQDSLVE